MAWHLNPRWIDLTAPSRGAAARPGSAITEPSSSGEGHLHRAGNYTALWLHVLSLA
jgi:hypothetical protein